MKKPNFFMFCLLLFAMGINAHSVYAEEVCLKEKIPTYTEEATVKESRQIMMYSTSSKKAPAKKPVTKHRRERGPVAPGSTQPRKGKPANLTSQQGKCWLATTVSIPTGIIAGGVAGGIGAAVGAITVCY